MKYHVTFLQYITHTVTVDARSFEEAEHKADIELSSNPGAYKREEDWWLESVAKECQESIWI
jgi:hypothetical protein